MSSRLMMWLWLLPALAPVAALAGPAPARRAAAAAAAAPDVPPPALVDQPPVPPPPAVVQARLAAERAWLHRQVVEEYQATGTRGSAWLTVSRTEVTYRSGSPDVRSAYII